MAVFLTNSKIILHSLTFTESELIGLVHLVLVLQVFQGIELIHLVLVRVGATYSLITLCSWSEL